jgi:hypothetical protein
MKGSLSVGRYLSALFNDATGMNDPFFRRDAAGI